MSARTESRARRKIRLSVEAKGYTLTELTWEPWGRAAEKEGIPGGWEGYVTPEPLGLGGTPAVMGLSVGEALEWVEQFLPARGGASPSGADEPGETE
jgi:hypothetical protein